MEKELIIKIAELLQSSEGTQETYKINTKLDFGKSLELTSDLTGKIMLMALKEGAHVEVKGLKTAAKQVCNRCLKEYSQVIEIDEASAEFLLELPKHKEDDEEFFLIDKKNVEIDLTDFLRQEIVLHLPLISVCSKSCKGLCPRCGIDLNKEKCDCKVEAQKERKPLTVLKYFKPNK